jgi:cellulose synthase/poly-beta-1,6-N-acetylglucosamine synthase-like glycosyltransferase
VKDVILILLFRLNFKELPISSKERRDYPFVSVLVSARNEEDTIRRCIRSLSNQNYPPEKYEILVGNDRSEDNTYMILKEMEHQIVNLKVFDITDLIQKRHGKMNVLAQLGKMVKGEFILFTDADTEVGQNWIPKHVEHMDSGYGIVTGTTLLDYESKMGQLQNIEWAHAIGKMKAISDLGINVSSIGNNMAISKAAYDRVGGFENIPFSITEDYEIFHQVCKRGFRSFHVYDKDVLASSVPLTNFWELLIQRKRWMYGAIRLPFVMLTLLVFNSLYYPMVIFLAIINPITALPLIFIRILLQGIFIDMAFRKLGASFKWIDVFLYELYAAVINLWAIVVFVLPFRIQWKNRKY